MGKLISIIVGAFVLLIAFAWLKPFTTVAEGTKGIVLDWGKFDRELNPGFNYIAPIGEEVIEVNIQTQVEEVEAGAASKDLQKASTKVAVNYNVLPDQVVRLYREVGLNYKNVLITPAIQEAVKAATAKYTAEELVTKREQVKSEISDRLKVRFQETGVLLLTQVSITDFQFSDAFDAAIELKVKAEQDALAQKNKLAQVEYEAQQKIASAKAEAEAIRLSSDAAQSDRYLKLKELEVELTRAQRWNGQLPTNVYGSAPIPFLNVNN